MTTHLRRFAVCLALGGIVAPAVLAAPAGQDAPIRIGTTLARFQADVNDYLSLRWRATRDLPPLPPSARLPEVIVALEQQVRAVRRARAGARYGEIFRTDASVLIRRNLALAIEEHGIDLTCLLDEVACDAPKFLARPRVNDRLPWLRAAAMPAVLLDALPELPFELRYRFLERDLIMLDLDLGLVVDVLIDALPGR